MRLDTGIIIFKGLAHVLVGVFTPWSAALAQWVNSGSWPERIVWVGVIVPASVVGGSSALLAFLSGAYRDYLESRDADKPTGVPTVPVPIAEVAPVTPQTPSAPALKTDTALSS